MKLRQAYDKYRELSDDQKQVLQNKTVLGLRTPTDWLAFLGPLASFDKVGDESRRILYQVFGLAGLVSLLGFFVMVGLFIGQHDSTPGLVAAAVSACAAVVTIVLWPIYSRVAELDLRNHLREVLIPFLRVLEQDMPAKALLRLKLDLAGTVDRKLVSKSDEDPGLWQYPKVKIRTYRDPWMTGAATLADGSALVFHGVDMLRRREVTRKGYRKVKTKTKVKVKHVFAVKLALRADTYGGAKLESRGKRGLYRASTVDVRDSEDGELTVHPLLNLLAAGFRDVHPAPPQPAR